MPKTSTLVFSVALSGYQCLFKPHLASHQQYAQRYGYDCMAVTQPRLHPLGMECAWLKIPLLLKALETGYEWVLYVDADARIQERAPPLASILLPQKTLYLAQGYSGRFNSGVILVKNDRALRQGLATLITQCEQPVAPEDDVGWGENGHIIAYAKNQPFIATLDKRWNNNQNPALDDYIRHYSMGPLRPKYRASNAAKIQYYFCRWGCAAYRRLAALHPAKQGLLHNLQVLTQQVQAYYPNYFAQGN